MAFDLSKFSDDDLMALSKGDISKLSDDALYLISGKQKEITPPKPTLEDSDHPFMSGLIEGGKAALQTTNRNLALGTVGLPSLGVDKLVQAVTGDETYANPVTKYVAGLVSSTDEQKERSKIAAQQGLTGEIGTMVGQVGGMVPEMLMGGAAAGPMKTMAAETGKMLPSVLANFQKGIAAAQPMATTAGLNKYEQAIESGNTGMDAVNAGLGGWANLTMQGALPMGAAGTLGKRAVTGAAVNAPAGMLGRQLENAVSPANMQSDVFDPKAIAMDALMGGTMHGILGSKGDTTKPVEKEPTTKMDVEQEANDKLIYAERRLGDAQTRLESLKTALGRATSKEGRDNVQNAIVKQIEYIKQETDTIERLKIGLNKTDEALAKRDLEETSAKVADAEKEMEALNQEYTILSGKKRRTPEEQQRLEEVQARYDELADFSEQNVAKLFGEEREPTMERYDPRMEETQIEQQIDAPRDNGVVSNDFVPGRTKGEVNEMVLEKDISRYSDDILVNMINNKQAKINEVTANIEQAGINSERGQSLLAFKSLLDSELNHIQRTLDSRGVDPKVYGETGKVSPELQVSVKNNNLRQGLEAIANNLTMPMVNRKVAQTLLNNKSIGKFIKMHYDSKSEFEAYTKRDSGDVVFKDESTVTPTNYLHEAIHSATSGMLLAFRKGTRFDHQVTRAINQLINIQESLNGRLKNQFLNEFGKFSSNAHVDIETILSNERELLAYAMSDTGVRKALEAIQWNGKSYMRKLVDSVADMFGWKSGKERSVLEAIFESGDILIQNSNGRGLLGQSGVDAIRSLTPSGDVGYAFGNKLLDNLTNLPNRVALRILNASAIKNFWPNHPLIKQVADNVELANRRMESNRSLILHGEVSLAQYKAGNFWTKMSKMEAPDGLLPSLSKVSFDKIGELVPYLGQAARDGVKLSQNLARYGLDTLSAEQKHLIETLEKTTNRVFELANESLISRGLPPIKSWGDGYIPSHIGKPFYVDVMFNGEILRREWYMTKTEAEQAQNVLGADKRVTTVVSERTRDVDYDSIESVLRESLERTKDTNISLENWINGKLEELALKNSSVGSHKQHKDFIRGFAGDKVGKTLEQQGKEFAHSIESWVNEYTNAIRKREILFDQAKLEATQPLLIQKNPNAHEVVRYMLSNEVGELKSLMEGKVSEAFNRVANEMAVKYLGMKNLERDVIPYAYSLLTRGAYNMVLTSAPVVWLTQTLGFINGQRMYFKDPDANPLHSAEAASKGLMKVLFQKYDPELMEAMHYVSQNFETLHKHLTNEISEFQWNEDKHHISNKIYSFVTGETFTTNADAISRTICFAQAVEFLRLQGKTGEKMWIEAARMTDDNMNAFGRKNLAGMYKELGAAGTMISPLKSFIHHQAGNLMIDVKDLVQQPSINSALALTANALSLMVMGGLLSTPFLADYEYLRGLLVKAGVIEEDALPNWTKIAEGMDPKLSRGVLSMTGIDMGASMRYSSFFKPFGDMIGAEGLTDMALPLSQATKFASGMTTVGRSIVGQVPEGEVKKAVKDVLPRGIPQGMADLAMNKDNPAVTFGTRGQMLTTRGPEEITAKFLGSRSVKEAHEATMNQQRDQHSKMITAQKQKAVDLYLSNGMGNRRAGVEQAKKLIAKGEWTEKEFVNAVKTMRMQQLRPINEAAVISNSGTVSKSNLRNYNYLKDMYQNDND